MKSIEIQLQPFEGYLELGMFAEANEVLESLPQKFKTSVLVYTARLTLLMEMQKWEEGAILGESLSKVWPSEHEFYFKTAYCLHELRRTKEAKATLESAPKAIRETALYFYNLACYEAQLGNVEKAKKCLNDCFAKDRRYRQRSLDDPDLEPIWSSLASC